MPLRSTPHPCQINIYNDRSLSRYHMSTHASQNVHRYGDREIEIDEHRRNCVDRDMVRARDRECKKKQQQVR